MREKSQQQRVTREVDANYKKREATWKKKLEGADETMREAAKKERKAGQLKRKWQAHDQLASKQMVEIRRDYSRKWKEQKCNVAAEEVERWEWT